MIFVLAKHYVNAVSEFDDVDPITSLQMSVQRINCESLSVHTCVLLNNLVQHAITNDIAWWCFLESQGDKYTGSMIMQYCHSAIYAAVHAIPRAGRNFVASMCIGIIDGTSDRCLFEPLATLGPCVLVEMSRPLKDGNGLMKWKQTGTAFTDTLERDTIIMNFMDIVIIRVATSDGTQTKLIGLYIRDEHTTSKNKKTGKVNHNRDNIKSLTLIAVESDIHPLLSEPALTIVDITVVKTGSAFKATQR